MHSNAMLKPKTKSTRVRHRNQHNNSILLLSARNNVMKEKTKNINAIMNGKQTLLCVSHSGVVTRQSPHYRCDGRLAVPLQIYCNANWIKTYIHPTLRWFLFTYDIHNWCSCLMNEQQTNKESKYFLRCIWWFNKMSHGTTSRLTDSQTIHYRVQTNHYQPKSFDPRYNYTC